MCFCPYLGSIGSDQGDKGIYRNRGHASQYYEVYSHACNHVCIPFSYMHGPISRQNWVRSEWSKYLWNQENRPNNFKHILHAEHTSLRACMLCACMLGPISHPNWVGSERWRYLWNREMIPDLSEYIIQPKHARGCAYMLCACGLAHISAKLEWIRHIKVYMESGEQA